MAKRKIVILITIFIIIAIIVEGIFIVKKHRNVNNKNISKNNDVQIKFDEETELYYIRNEETRRNNISKL